MDATRTAPTTIDAYIADFPEEIQAILQRIRETVQAAAPHATEAIKYQMPTFVAHNNLVHFAAFKHHIGFYPAPAGIEAFEEELAPYMGGKGSARFPLDQPIPYGLIEKIVRFRVEDDFRRSEEKRARKKR